MAKPHIIISCDYSKTVVSRVSQAITLNDVRGVESKKEIRVVMVESLDKDFAIKETPFDCELAFSKRCLKFGFKHKLKDLALALQR